MQNNTKIAELKNNLPLGGRKEICTRTGLTMHTVARILNGKNGRIKTVTKIITAAEQIINEFNTITHK